MLWADRSCTTSATHFHGECDLGLVSSKDADVHLRTTIKWDRYSYIEKVGIRIGTHKLEFDAKQFIIDGILREHNTKFPIHFNNPEEGPDQASVTIAKKGKKNYQFSWERIVI